MKLVLAVIGLVAVLIISPSLAYVSQPWSPWWLTRSSSTAIAIGGNAPVDELVVPRFGPAPIVSDLERFLLALGAGFSFDEAITATAISIAEDGGGDPAARSARNRDGSYDLGLWQINSGWWAQFGGEAALIVPSNNARAARVIYGRQGWCAWSTYDARCGAGHTGAYAAYLARAGVAAGGDRSLGR